MGPASRVDARRHRRRRDPRPIRTTPVDVGWPARADATLIGDAAHLMAPTGDGANQAMLDGASLGTAIARAVASGSPLADAVREYEAEMFPRARAVAAHSRRLDEAGISPNAAQTVAAVLGSAS